MIKKFDFSNLEILNMNIANARNDCFDVSTGKYFVNNAVLKNCGDKGFSIGEASDFKGLQIAFLKYLEHSLDPPFKDCSKALKRPFKGL